MDLIFAVVRRKDVPGSTPPPCALTTPLSTRRIPVTGEDVSTAASPKLRGSEK